MVLHLDHKQNKNESRNRRDIVRASHKEKRKTEPQIQWRSWDRPKNSSSLLINSSWKILNLEFLSFLENLRRRWDRAKNSSSLFINSSWKDTKVRVLSINWRVSCRYLFCSKNDESGYIFQNNLATMKN